MPAPRKLLLDDFQLLDALAAGKSIATIARENGVSPQATRWRIQQLKRNLPAPAARRAEETVAVTLDAVHELQRSHALLGEMREACTRLLADETGRLDVGPHDYDVEVLVSLGGQPPTRKALRDIIGHEEGDVLLSLEAKHADPRTLLLATIKEIRQHIQLAVTLTERIHDAQELARFQAEILALVERVSPEEGNKLRSLIHERHQLRLALTPPNPR